ncbi:hypothetical protein [Streptomyces sp. NBC_00259]|uniref:hypothetical protein n=1 Tax=Streptomyces sp. NBC_00259 TaxID=2903643 RepID=UPI002E2AFF34|nr:hypothetical protein [Streptomyces sp. NBC_00259]
MAAMPKKVVIPLAALLCVASATAAAYAFGFPPFERRGDIRASDVCESLGKSAKVVPALKGSLPSEPGYKFDDRLDGRDITQGASDYTADCLVWGEGRVLLSARTEMMLTETAENMGSETYDVRDWAKEALNVRESDIKSFTAGTRGVNVARKAAILVPCASPGHIPGGTYSLSVVVDLRKHEGSGKPEVRQDLIDLAINAARFSHQKAKCDLPSRLPG